MEKVLKSDIDNLIEKSKYFDFTNDALNFLRSELLKLPTI